jgi:hypothetical protein
MENHFHLHYKGVYDQISAQLPLVTQFSVWQIENRSSLSCQDQRIILTSQTTNIDAFKISIILKSNYQFIPITFK